MEGYNLHMEAEDGKDLGEWCLAGESDQIHRVVVQYSKSGRAKCRKCGEFIATKTLRIGKPIKWRGFITSWTHLECFWVEVSDEASFKPIEKEEIFGFASLSASDKRRVLKQVKCTKPPDELEIITPDDPGFTKSKPLNRVNQPPGITLRLLPFQEEGYGWMLDQENSIYGGGILADEMGMGKTIQSICLIANDKSLNRNHGPTLIVCPSSAMLQWKVELERCTSKGLLKVLVFHGTQRSLLTPAEILRHDVVLTTYPTLENAYRSCVNLAKVPCKYCNKLFVYRKLLSHNKYFCGPNAMRTKRLSKTERTRESATNKAMKTLGITKNESSHSLPTPGNIYRELMKDANRKPVSMYENKTRAAQLQEEAASSLKTSTSEPIESPTSRLNVWMHRTAEIFVWRGKERHKWHSNFLDKSMKSFVVFNLLDENENDIILETETQDLLLRLAEPNIAYSLDKGKTWSDLGFGTKDGVKGEWLNGSSIELKDFDILEKSVGSPLFRQFENSWYLGLVVGHYADDEDEIWRVIHTDKDFEDLNKGELKRAQQVSSEKAFLKQYLDALNTGKKKKSAHRCLIDLLKSNKHSSTKLSDSDSDFVDSCSDEDSASSDEEFIPSKSKSKPESDEESAYSDNESETILKPSFLPATWNENSEMFALLKRRSKGKRKFDNRNQKTKKKKKRNNKVKKSKGSLDSEEDEFLPKKKKSKNECASDRKDTDCLLKIGDSNCGKNRNARRTKGYEDDETTSESSDAESVVESSGPFTYAKIGDVVDDDGFDLGEINLLDRSYSFQGCSLLHCIAWHRVILDEAHKIKDRVNSTARATFSLRGDPKLKGAGTGSGGGLCHRWCLTGTPMQNRVGELYSLVRFLRVDPYAYYFCSAKDCSCKSLNWTFGAMSRSCVQCGHPPMKHYSYFNKFIMNPIKRIGYTGEGRLAMIRLRDDLLGKIMLRRTKVERQDDIRLPELNVVVETLELNEYERDFYESVYKHTRSKFDTYVQKGTLLHNYAHIFELLSRLRRSADHPYLVIHSNQNTTIGENNTCTFPSRSSGRSDVCGICNFDIESIKECALSHCRHTFHKSCIKELLEENESSDNVAKKPKMRSNGTKQVKTDSAKFDPGATCPVCFQPLSITFDVHGDVSNDLTTNQQEESLCIICFENPRDALLTPCGHLYTCVTCVKGLSQRSCPICRKDIKKVVKVDPKTVKSNSSADGSSSYHQKPLIGRKNFLQKINLENFASSSKIDGVVREVQKMLKLPLQLGEDPHKAIIFSQYTDMIDLVEWKLRTSGVKTVRLVGSMPVAERESVLNAFRDVSSGVSVILMSLKAGGEGLNLQVASHVMILETWWNPQVHNQAFQRAHRIGQKRPVRAILFVTKATIEEKMHELQEKKQLIFEGAIDGSASAIQQLNLEDLRFLFAR